MNLILLYFFHIPFRVELCHFRLHCDNWYTLYDLHELCSLRAQVNGVQVCTYQHWQLAVRASGRATLIVSPARDHDPFR